MTIEDLFWIVFQVFVIFGCFGIGAYYGVRQCLSALSNMEDDKFQDIVKGLRDNTTGIDVVHKVIKLELTAENGMLLAHNSDTGEFVSQGISSTEIIKRAFNRYPNSIFVFNHPSIESKSIDE